MKRIIFTIIGSTFLLHVQSQTTLPRAYEYDNAGNRIVRKVITLSSIQNEDNNTVDKQEENTAIYYQDNLSDMDILIYPSATSSEVKIVVQNGNNEIKGQAQVYNSLGVKVFEKNIFGEITQLNFNELSKGIYYIVLQINGKETQWKIIKK